VLHHPVGDRTMEGGDNEAEEQAQEFEDHERNASHGDRSGSIRRNT
jgi:hypothetical protein